MKTTWIVIGSLFGFLAVALGAFGAHALQNKLDSKAMDIFRTATQYHFFHALALILVGLYSISSHSPMRLPGFCFTFGIVLFSGSLYALVWTDIRSLGAITPFGGLLFLVGWISFGVYAWRNG